MPIDSSSWGKEATPAPYQTSCAIRAFPARIVLLRHSIDSVLRSLEFLTLYLPTNTRPMSSSRRAAGPPSQFRPLGRGIACAISESRSRFSGMSNTSGKARLPRLDSSRPPPTHHHPHRPRQGASLRDKGSAATPRAAGILRLAQSETRCREISLLWCS